MWQFCAARLSAEGAALADVEFHRAIATATGNEFFEVPIDSIREPSVQRLKVGHITPLEHHRARAAHQP